MSDSEPAPSTALRNRIVSRFLERPEAARGALVLANLAPDMAVLLAEPKSQIVVVSCPEAPEAQASFLDRLGDVVFNQPSGLVVFLVAGGGEAARSALGCVAAKSPDPAHLGLYHVNDDGTWTHVVGRKLPLVKSVLAEIQNAVAVDDETLRAKITALTARYQEAQHYSTGLRSRLPLASLTIIAVCAFIFLAGILRPDSPWGASFQMVGKNVGALVAQGQWWRLLTSAFLHGSMTHVAMNMLVLYFIGTFVEQTVGRYRFVMLYFASALAGAGLSAALSPLQPSVGASGAIWGVMAAGFGLSLWPRGALPDLMAARLRRGLQLTLVINVLFSFAPGIDLWAHFGGGAVGLLAAYLGLAGNPRGPRPKPVFITDHHGESVSKVLPTSMPVKAAALALVGATALSLLAAYQVSVEASMGHGL